MNDTWLKLYRRLLDWQWYTDANTMRVFMHLLLTANYKQNMWKSETVEAGQLITSVNRLASDLNLSIKQIRNSLKKLQKSNDIHIKGANRYSLITLVNWDVYQSEGQTKGNQGANKGQTKGNQRATLKESKKGIRVEGKNKTHDASLVSRFDEFWNMYPKKPNNPRKPAQAKFDNLVKKGTDAQLIIDGAGHYASYCKVQNTEAKYIAQATTWLNQERWANDYSAAPKERTVMDMLDDLGPNQIKDVTPCN